MTVLLAGWLMGVGGSLHCVAMCGPLVLLAGRGASAPAARPGTRWRELLVRLAWHHTGRIGVYGGLGIIAGGTGELVAGAGLRQALAISVGVGLTLAAVWSLFGHRTMAFGSRWQQRAAGLIAQAGRRLRRDRWLDRLALGGVNGLLPCGLLYGALIAAASLGSATAGAGFMVAFGLGLVPALLAIASSAGLGRMRSLLRRASPIAAALVGILLVLRGLGMPGASAHPGSAHSHVLPIASDPSR